MQNTSAGVLRSDAWIVGDDEAALEPALYQAHVTQAPKGCELAFLEAPAPADRVFVEPVVGRS